MTSFKTSVSNFCRTVPLVCRDHKHEILQALYQQQQAGILCDIYIVIEQEKVPAHKAVLAASSKYFSALFETGQETDVAGSKAGNVREIVLSSVPRSTFFPILHFMYTSALHVFRENVHDILNTARKLQITSIVKICTKITEDHVVLPSLKDLDKFDNQGNDHGNGKKNDVLYVDLGLCNNVQENSSVQSSSQYNDYSQQTSLNSGYRSLSEAATQAVEHQPLVQSSSISNSLEAPAELAEISISDSVSSDVSNINSSTSEIQNSLVGFSCSQCPKSFKKKANLKRHVLIKHSSLHKFVCPKCGKRYAIEQSLQYHISTSKCSKKVSPQYQSSASIIQPSVADSQLSVLVNSSNSEATNIPGYLNDETMIDSGIETLGDSSILQQSLVSVNPGDSLSLVIPSTTLFPSLANIHEESLSSNFNHLDALNNIAAEHSISSSSSMEPKETFLCSSSNFPSDEDMPTIKSIQSIKTITAYPDAEVEVDHGHTLPESNGDSSETLETSINSSAADTTSTARDCLEIGNKDGAPKLIRIAPKTPLMMPLRRQQKHKLSAGREKVPVVMRSPINISTLSTCLNLNSNSDVSEHSVACEVAPACSSESRTEGASRASRDGTELHIVGKCMVCGRSFHSTDSLIYHKRKCCKCPFCNRFSNMKRHVGIFHTKLKPHECSICGRAYGIKQSLRFHMEAKHGIPYVTRKYNRNAAKLSKDTSQTSL